MSDISAPAVSTPAPAGSVEGSPSSPSSGTPTPAGAGSSPTPAGAAPPPPGQEAAAEVMRRRDAAGLARLMRERREVDARAAQVQEAQPQLEAFRRIQELVNAGDHARATRTMYEAVLGPERARDAFPDMYKQLTSEIVGVESTSQIKSQLDRELAHLQRQQQELSERLARGQAEYEETMAEVRTERTQSAMHLISTKLEAAQSQYPHLMAESDDPAQVVWEIMLEALDRGEEPPSWDAAAKHADTFYQPIFEKKKTRYQTLLSPQRESGAAQPAAPISQNGARTSLTNADASTVPDLRSAPQLQDRDASIEAAWRRLQERSRTQ